MISSSGLILEVSLSLLQYHSIEGKVLPEYQLGRCFLNVLGRKSCSKCPTGALMALC